jgi:hypothetical protein
MMTIAIVAIFSCDCIGGRAAADGGGVHHARKALHGYRAPEVPGGCPQYPTPCYSLYGRYQPYGGSVYWSRFTYGGWFR